MNAGLFAKRSAAALILLIWLAPAAHAAAAGVLVPFPDRGEDRARHKRPVLSENMPFPGTMSSTPVVPVQVHPLFPNDGAVFPANAAISLSWRMPDEVALPPALRRVPKYFLLVVTGHTHPAVNSTKTFPWNGKSPTYTGLFNATVSGRYGWQVTAVMDDDSIIKSPARYFVVSQPNYYDKYFTTVPDVYPHYYYDSSEFRR